jgi:hypothetical protein
MIKRCRDEAGGAGGQVVTKAAIGTGLHVTNVFTRGYRTIMARGAIIHDPSVIKGRRYKARGLVAHTAVFASGHMVSVLAYGGNTIVTGHAVIYDTLMIKFGTSEGRGVMADRTIFRGGNMVR